MAHHFNSAKTQQEGIVEGKEKVFYPIEKTLKYNEDYNLVNKEIWEALVDKFQASMPKFQTFNSFLINNIEFPILLFSVDKNLASPELVCLSGTDEPLLDKNKIVILDSINIKIVSDGKQQKTLKISVPQQITIQKLCEFLKKELELYPNSSTKVKFEEKTLGFQEIADKKLSDLEISEGMTITFSNKEQTNEMFGLLDLQNLNFNNNNNEHQQRNDGNLNNETDVSSGNVMQESVKSMSTSIIYSSILFRKLRDFIRYNQ